MKVYIDVTNLIKVDFLTGIQRVVREVLLRMIKQREYSLVLLNYNEYYNVYQIVDTDKFYSWFQYGEGDRQKLLLAKRVEWDTFMPGDIFFDIDGVWNLSLRRSVLLPKLHANGVKLVVYIYDIIPITQPQFCHGNTVNNFMNYIGAYLQYADAIIASTQSTLDAIDELLKQLNLPPIKGYVSWLGSDFHTKQHIEDTINSEAIYAAEQGKYVLMVGTIEPRKNHTMVLDAFDNKLFECGMNLIFAGRIGWNVQDVQHRIEQHSKLGKQLFFLEKMNDATIDYLYKNAYCVAFPTFNEGFGLPIIESFQRGTPVIASDIPVLREVGGNLCKYFNPQSWESFSTELQKLIKNSEEYENLKRQIADYVPVTWDEVSRNIEQALSEIEVEFPYSIPDTIRQMVYLTARADDLLNSLPFVEAFMPFIEEIVLCCPDVMVSEMQEKYHGKLKLQYITDSELLDGKPLPEDHAKRNFYLRCLAMKKEQLDSVFIMSDDDYRPLYPIMQDVFIKDGKYQGYYCYHLQDWMGDQKNPTSFDISMYRTRDFLRENGYSTWMYDAHMPQIIDRRVFLEILDKFPDIEQQGLSDWSVYFNYLSTRYSNQIVNKPYVTVGWPGIPSAWNMQVDPMDYIFENYYSELYEEGNVFEGLSEAFYSGIEQENYKKITKYMHYINRHNRAKIMFHAYCSNYEMVYGEYPYFAIELNGDECKIILPQYVAICEDEFVRIPFDLRYKKGDAAYFDISYFFMDVSNNHMLDGDLLSLKCDWERFELPIKGMFGGVKAILGIVVHYQEKEFVNYTNIRIVKK